MGPQSAHRLGYRPSLDSLRAFAVFSVVAAHIGLPHLDGGIIGVDVFFVLSGFLITSLLLEEQARLGSIDFLAFYQRRSLRLFPALAVLIPVVALVAEIAPTVDRRIAQFTLEGIPWVLLYVANWARAMGTSIGLFGHTWSLAIEEQFYVVWPVVLSILVGSAKRYRRALIIAVIAIAAVAIYRTLSWVAGVGVDRVGNGSDMRADSLLMGCAIALAPYAGVRLRVPIAVTALAAGFLIWSLMQDPRTGFLYPTGLTAVAFASAIVVLALVQSPHALAVGPLVWLGRISYGIYLWHYPIVLVTPLRWPLGVRAIFVISATLAVASLSWFVVERRFLALKPRRAA